MHCFAYNEMKDGADAGHLNYQAPRNTVKKPVKCNYHPEYDCIANKCSIAGIIDECLACYHVDELDRVLINLEHQKSNVVVPIQGEA